jgi:hypothetical protein
MWTMPQTAMRGSATTLAPGRMAEWTKATVLKTVGGNPSRMMRFAACPEAFQWSLGSRTGWITQDPGLNAFRNRRNPFRGAAPDPDSPFNQGFSAGPTELRVPCSSTRSETPPRT